MTDYSSNTAFDTGVTSTGIGPSDFAPPAQNDGAEPIDAGVRAVRAVHAALSGQLGRPLNILGLDGNPNRGSSCFASVFALTPAGHFGCYKTFADPRYALIRAVARVRVAPDNIESFNTAVASGRYDLVVCSAVPRDAGDNPDRTAFLEAMGACADTVGAVVFETAWDDRAAEKRDDVQHSDLERLRRSFAFVHAVYECNDDNGREYRVVLFCSNRYWYADGHLDAFDSWTPNSSEVTGGVHQGTRRYFFGTDKIAKNYCFYGSPAWNNRREMDSEVSFLSNPPIEGKSIPRLVAYHIGGSDGVLIMQRLPGILLTTAVLQAIDYNPALVLRGLLECLNALERVNLYHNDVAQWNVLVNADGGSALIDFASITKVPRSSHWPYDPILHYFLFAQTVIRRRFLFSPMGLFPIVPFGLPRWYRRWAALVWSRPRKQRDFALLKTCLEAALDDHPSRRRQSGVIGTFSRWFRRLLYTRALIALQMRYFVKRLEIVTIRGIVRYALAAVGRSPVSQPIRPLHRIGRPHSQD